MSGIDFSQLSKKRPEKTLLKCIKRNVGRGSSGRITVRHKGGGVKKLYRIIEFTQTKMDSPAKVIAIEYDPNRTAFIALIEYKDGDKQYIVAPHNLKIGDRLEIIPNHICPVVNNFDTLFGVQNHELIREFKVLGRGKYQ